MTDRSNEPNFAPYDPLDSIPTQSAYDKIGARHETPAPPSTPPLPSAAGPLPPGISQQVAGLGIPPPLPQAGWGSDASTGAPEKQRLPEAPYQELAGACLSAMLRNMTQSVAVVESVRGCDISAPMDAQLREIFTKGWLLMDTIAQCYGHQVDYVFLPTKSLACKLRLVEVAQ